MIKNQTLNRKSLFVIHVQWILIPHLLLCSSGDAFEPKYSTWPMEELEERRKEQNCFNASVAKNATEGLTYSEEEMLVVGENERKLDVMKITHISLGSSF